MVKRTNKNTFRGNVKSGIRSGQMSYQIIVNGRLYEVAVDSESQRLIAREIDTAPNLKIPFVVLKRLTNVPDDFREMVKHSCTKGYPIFPVSETEGPMAEELIRLGWEPCEKTYVKRKRKAEEIANTLSITDDYNTSINGYFVHTITPEYLILQKENELIPVFFGEEEGDIQEITRDHIKGSFLNGPIKYERRSKEHGITLVAY